MIIPQMAWAIPATYAVAKHRAVPVFVDVLRIAVVTAVYARMKTCVRGAVLYRNVTVAIDTSTETSSIARSIGVEHVSKEETKIMFDQH